MKKVKNKKSAVTNVFIVLSIVAIIVAIVTKNLKQQTIEVNCQITKIKVGLIEEVCDVKVVKTLFGKVLYNLD